jgi:hypothetical protein
MKVPDEQKRREEKRREEKRYDRPVAAKLHLR